MTVKAGALKPGSSGRGAVSLIRGRIGEENATAAAKTYVHPKDFWGFGAALAGVLSVHCEALEDDRATFCGHANMLLGYTIPAGPPNTPPEMTQVYEDAMKRLIGLASNFVVTQAAA